jgi:hypothetical protein
MTSWRQRRAKDKEALKAVKRKIHALEAEKDKRQWTSKL